MKRTIKLLFFSFLICSFVFVSLNARPAYANPSITRIQNVRNHGTNVNSLTVSISTPSEGNVLVLVSSTDGDSAYPSISSITQTGVSWSYIVHKNWASYRRIAIWFGVVGSNPSDSLTVNYANPAASAIVIVCEYSGVATSDYLDKTATNSGYSSTTDTGTTATTTQDEELWVGVVADPGLAHSNPTNGFTMLYGAADYNPPTAYLEKIVSSTGQANSGTTLSGVEDWAGCIATFKAYVNPPPQYSNVDKNSTQAWHPCLFSCKWTDDSGLSGYIFSWNISGSWQNDTWTDPWTGTPTSGWSNVSKSLQAKQGTVLGWRIYCNDTENAWNDTGIQTFTLTATGWCDVEDWHVKIAGWGWWSVETWNVILDGRQFTFVESWNAVLTGKAWQTIESWLLKIVGKSFNLVEHWRSVFPLHYMYYVRISFVSSGLLLLCLVPTLLVFAIKKRNAYMILSVFALFLISLILLHLFAVTSNYGG